MNKKHLSKSQTILILALMTLLHCICVFGVYILAYSPLSDLNIPEMIGYTIFFSPFLIPIICDMLLRSKTNIHPFATLFTPVLSAIIFFAFYLIVPTPEGSPYYGENYIYFTLALISFAVRCLYSMIDTISLKKAKLIIASLLAVLISFGSVAGSLVFEDDINKFIATKDLGTADKTGSWGSINQNIERDENWQQIVTDTPFKLGEITAVTNEDGFTDNYCDKGTYPHIDGSTVCVPMAVEFARQHLNFEDRTANQFVQFSTTHHAYENLMDPMSQSRNYVHYNLNAFIDMKSVDLVIATEPSDEELAQAEESGVTFVKEPVCYDAFVFITHKNNPIDSLTVEQIKKIYSGEITNWKDVGGKDEKIRAFQREKNSGSQTAMENLVMGGADMIDPIEVKVIMGMGGLVDAVAEYENNTASIGYTYRYYIDTLYKNDNIKTIAVNGIAPTDSNIRSGVYPFTTNYYGVIRQGEEDEIGGQFLSWILSDEGQKCVAQAGYITLS